MNITAIVQVVWVATVFSTAFIVVQALTQNSFGNQTPTLFQSTVTEAFDGSTEAPSGASTITGEMSIAWPYWKESL